jgi:hypothetical protein
MKNKKAEEAPKPAASAEKKADEDKEEGEIQSKEMRRADMLTFFLILVNSFNANGFSKFSLYLTPHLKGDSDVNL